MVQRAHEGGGGQREEDSGKERDLVFLGAKLLYTSLGHHTNQTQTKRYETKT